MFQNILFSTMFSFFSQPLLIFIYICLFIYFYLFIYNSNSQNKYFIYTLIFFSGIVLLYIF